MSKKGQLQEILPWKNSELESLLKDLITHGTETAKADYKLEIEANTPEQKADILKDISSIANTYDDNFSDYGFLIYGVKAKDIIGVTKTESDTDKLQNHIEQLLKTYISPMPQIYVTGFETTDGKKWGAIIIPPRNNKPYMFFKDLSCTDRTHTRRKGEWFMRHGSTTDPGLPEDLAIITQKQTDLLLEPLRESIRTLQIRVGKTEDQYNSALFKLVERAVSSLPQNIEQKTEEKETISDELGETLGMDLSARLKQKLRTPKDAIAEDLIAEAKTIKDFIDGATTGLPWTPQPNDAIGNKKIIEDLEEKTKAFQLSVATIILNDKNGTYTDALLRAIKILAKTTEVPSGTAYNRLGEAIRYYPLGLIIYTIFICGVAANRGDILKQILEIPIKHPRQNATSPITNIFRYWYEAGMLFNDAFAQRWCEPISQRIRQVLNDRISEMITEFSEPEYFFRGEFVLALSNINVNMNDGKDIENSMPSPGLYIYMHEASEPIADFVIENPDWFNKIYDHPLNEILEAFDQNHQKMASQNCFASGLSGLKTAELYQKSLQKKAKK